METVTRPQQELGTTVFFIKKLSLTAGPVLTVKLPSFLLVAARDPDEWILPFFLFQCASTPHHVVETTEERKKEGSEPFMNVDSSSLKGYRIAGILYPVTLRDQEANELHLLKPHIKVWLLLSRRVDDSWLLFPFLRPTTHHNDSKTSKQPLSVHL